MITKDVTTQAKAIFGEDIVKVAYQDVTGYWEYRTKGGGVGSDNIISNTAIEPQDGCDVYIEFINGKKFRIWSSEWGGVTAIEG